MEYRVLGKTGLNVSTVSIGLWAIGGDAWGPVNDEDSLAAMQKAWELGVNFYDTADVYGRGRSEGLLARFVKNVPRDKIYIATKVGLWRKGSERPNPYTDPAMVIEECEASLQRLGIDYIDVYQDHLWWDENTEVFATAFLKLKEQGKIRFGGVSTNDFTYIRHFDEAMDGMDTLQIDYSFLNRRPEQDALPYCQEHNIGVIVRGPLAMGKLTGKFNSETTFPEGDVRRGWTSPEHKANFLNDLERAEKLRFLTNGRTMSQAALAYVLAHPAVSTAIPGAKTPQQVIDNVGAVEHKFTEIEMSQLNQALE
jgi:aryl-alcohol dehydrogenase-like predicted oxidoreductase